MEFDPEWLHNLQHVLSKKLDQCKSCGKTPKLLYHCKDCMIGIYCSSKCQALDIEHPCLIGVRGRDDDDDKGDVRPRRRRRIGPPDRQMGELQQLPDYVLRQILQYVSRSDILSVRQLSRALNRLILEEPELLPRIPVRLSINQIDTLEDTFRNWIRDLTITDSNRMSVDELRGLVEMFPNLEKLSIRRYSENDIEPLRNLTSLEELSLGLPRVDITPLSGLINLKMLILDYYMGSIEPLRGLINLETLSLRAYNGNDIEPLRDLVNLKNLELFSYRGNIDPIRGLVKLEQLSLAHYNGNIKPLSNLINLKTLNLYEYQGNIDPIRGLVKLKQLYIAYYNGTIEPLSGLTNLEVLFLLSYTGNNVEPLHKLTKLTRLNLRSYQGNLQPLYNLSNLERLNLLGHPNQEAVEALKRHLKILE